MAKLFIQAEAKVQFTDNRGITARRCETTIKLVKRFQFV